MELTTATNHTDILKQELSWASHLSLPAVLLPPPRTSGSNINYFRTIAAALRTCAHRQLWITMPMGGHGGDHQSTFGSDDTAGSSTNAERMTSWQTWSVLKTLCEHHPNLRVALVIPDSLPDAVSGHGTRSVFVIVCTRWTDRSCDDANVLVDM